MFPGIGRRVVPDLGQGLVVHKHEHPDFGHLGEGNGREHWNTNAAVTSGLGRNLRITMNGHAAKEIVRVVEPSESALLPACYFTQHPEVTRRSDCAACPALGLKILAASRRDRQDLADD